MGLVFDDGVVLPEGLLVVGELLVGLVVEGLFSAISGLVSMGRS